MMTEGEHNKYWEKDKDIYIYMHIYIYIYIYIYCEWRIATWYEHKLIFYHSNFKKIIKECVALSFENWMSIIK